MTFTNPVWQVTQLHPVETDDTTETVLNGITVLVAAGIGILAGLILAVLVTSIAKVIGRKDTFTRLLFRRITRPLAVVLMLTGAYMGIDYALSDFDVTSNQWIARGIHILVLVIIGAATWLLVKAIYVIEDIVQYDPSGRSTDRHSRMFTQAQIIRRVLQAVVVVLGLATMVLTFPFARVAMSSVLASAGLASIVATLAAQSMLANMFAGLQIALSDSMRVGDTIQIDGLDGVKEFGTIEEITLTYVSVKLYDERRMVVPSSRFTQQPFENWTRRAQQLLGTVELFLDFTAPIGAIRARVDYLLSMTDLWDGRTASVVVTDMNEDRMTVRILVSAKDSDDVWTLRCYLREEMIAWIVAEMPWALATKRIRPLQVQQVEHDRSIQEITELAEELAGISGSGPADPTQPSTTPRPHTLAEARRPLAGQRRYPAPAYPKGKTEKRTGKSVQHEARLRAARARSHHEAAMREQQSQRERHTQLSPQLSQQDSGNSPARRIASGSDSRNGQSQLPATGSGNTCGNPPGQAGNGTGSGNVDKEAGGLSPVKRRTAETTVLDSEEMQELAKQVKVQRKGIFPTQPAAGQRKNASNSGVSPRPTEQES